jgi:hypothetical protein
MTVGFVLFLNVQFTTDIQNVLRLTYAWYILSWTVVPFQRSRSDWEWFDGHQKCICEMSLSFKLKLNTLRVLIVPADENLKNWSPENGVDITLKTVCAQILILIIFLFFCEKLTPDIFPNLLDTPCIIRILLASQEGAW